MEWRCVSHDDLDRIHQSISDTVKSAAGERRAVRRGPGASSGGAGLREDDCARDAARLYDFL